MWVNERLPMGMGEATLFWKDVLIGVLLGCFARKTDGPGLPGGLIIYQAIYVP